MTFEEIITRSQKSHQRFVGSLLTFDPGETTGYSLWQDHGLIESGQLKTWPIEDAVGNFSLLLLSHRPITFTVFETYRIYNWKTDDHSNSEVPALQVIGCLKTILYQHGLIPSEQTAQIAKEFCTDAKLKEWGFWKEGQPHARDAIRHGAYHLLFGPHSKTLSPPANQKPS